MCSLLDKVYAVIGAHVFNLCPDYVLLCTQIIALKPTVISSRV
jgi:hypothetical protein